MASGGQEKGLRTTTDSEADVPSNIGSESKFSVNNVYTRMHKELKKNPNVATVHAFGDFPYTANNFLPIPLIKRDYWLKISREMLANTELAGKDGFIILHVHYSGEWRASDTQADFDKKRLIITPSYLE